MCHQLNTYRHVDLVTYEKMDFPENMVNIACHQKSTRLQLPTFQILAGKLFFEMKPYQYFRTPQENKKHTETL